MYSTSESHGALQNQKRGVISSNPQGGRLAAKLEAGKSAPRVPEPRQEERIVVSACSAILTVVRGSTEACRSRSGTDGMSLDTIGLLSQGCWRYNGRGILYNPLLRTLGRPQVLVPSRRPSCIGNE